jgi:hypothetical protein
MILAESNVDIAGQAAAIATFAVVATGGALYLFGSIVPISVDVSSFERIFLEGEYSGRPVIQVQAQVKSRTRNSVLITDFGWIADPGPGKRKWITATETVEGVQEFLGSPLPAGGLEVPGHTTVRLSGMIPSEAVPAQGIAVVLVVAGRPLIRPVPPVTRAQASTTPTANDPAPTG